MRHRYILSARNLTVQTLPYVLRCRSSIMQITLANLKEVSGLPGVGKGSIAKVSVAKVACAHCCCCLLFHALRQCTCKARIDSCFTFPRCPAGCPTKRSRNSWYVPRARLPHTALRCRRYARMLFMCHRARGDCRDVHKYLTMHAHLHLVPFRRRARSRSCPAWTTWPAWARLPRRLLTLARTWL